MHAIQKYKNEISFSSFFLFLAFAFPMLIPFHVKPLQQFGGEFLIAFFISMAWLMSRGCQYKVCLLDSGFFIVSVLAVSICSILWVERSAGAAYFSYSMFFIVSYIFGIAGRQQDTTSVVAGGLFVSGLLQALVVIAGLTNFADGFWVLPMASGRAVGNIAHPNHLSISLVIGLCSLAWLLDKRVIGQRVFLALGLLLALGVAAAGSKSAWLVIPFVVVLGWWATKTTNGKTGRSFILSGFVLVLGQMLYALILALGVVDSYSVIDRIGDSVSNGGRWYAWTVAREAILSRWGIGHGPDSFWRVSIEAMQYHAAQPFPMLIENAHNFPLGLAAEFGVPVCVVVIGAVMFWAWRCLRAPANAERIWAIACVGILLVHSFFEYPLWYLYFLIPCGICMGLAEPEHGAARSFTLSTWWLRTCGLLTLLCCLWVLSDWMHVRLAYRQLALSSELTARIMSLSARDELDQLSRYSLLAPQAESLRLQSFSGELDDLKLATTACELGFESRPTWLMLKSCAEVFAISGRETLLNRVVDVQCKGFPREHALLQLWANDFDKNGKAQLPLRGRACIVGVE